MRVLVTGANGFIGRNLLQHLSSRRDTDVVSFVRGQNSEDLASLVSDVDFVFHLAGVNRPQDDAEFVTGNTDLTDQLCKVIADTGKKIPILYSSSTQAVVDNPYGASKRAAERVLFDLSETHGVPVYVFRLPNVFGKWSRPNYNSAIATFCHNVARGMPIQINDPAAKLTLVYIDDVVDIFLGILDGNKCPRGEHGFCIVDPVYTTTVGLVAGYIRAFKESRDSLLTERVGTGLMRALYSTYLSFLPVADCVYSVPQHEDARGIFVEMLKTPDCGQFSFFTAHPGVTRGGHYHHTKTEKFLVIRGTARFRCRHLVTGETYERVTSGAHSEIVETLPGWTHDVTNIGDEELIVMLWANEIFDRAKPDTFTEPV